MTSYIRPARSHLRVFQPDEHGTLRCRGGHVPTLRHTFKKKTPYDIYRVSQCAGCAIRSDCRVPEKAHQKEVTLRAGTPFGAREDNLDRTKTERGRELLKLRGETVELVFARLKAGWNFRRFKLRNLKGVKLEYSLLTLAYNLRLLARGFEALFGLFFSLFRQNTTGRLEVMASAGRHHRLLT